MTFDIKSPTSESGVPASQLKRFAGVISSDDAKLIERAIEEGCEDVREFRSE
jgi:hypothetical protein